MENLYFDNNAKIPILDGMRYFYGKTDDINFVPHIEIAMADVIDLSYMQMAAELAMCRYPVFRLSVMLENEQYYLVDNLYPPVVHTLDGQRHIFSVEENNNHLVWIGVDKNHLVVEFFHGISDIHGILPFIRLLLRNYCEMYYQKKSISSFDFTCTALSEHIEECMDSLLFIADNPKIEKHNSHRPVAFQFPNDMIRIGPECFVYSLKVDSHAFDAYMRRNASSRTAVFSVFMNHAISEYNTLENAPIISAIAADVRKIYGAESTLRDCTSLIPLLLNDEIKGLPLPQQLAYSRLMILNGIDPEKQLAEAAWVKANNILMQKRNPTLSKKKNFCQKLRQFSCLNYTYSISNSGRISFGSDVDDYILSVETIMCANSHPVILEIVQYKDHYHICYSTRLINDPYVHKFQSIFLREGIPCTCEQKENFIEPLVLFDDSAK